MKATEQGCCILTGIGSPCHPYDGVIVWDSESIVTQEACDIICGLSEDMAGFLRLDLDAVVGASLAPDILMRLHEYQDAELKKLAKVAILEALTEHLYNDGEVDMPSETWATAKADAIASVQTSLSAGLVAEVEQIAVVKK